MRAYTLPEPIGDMSLDGLFVEASYLAYLGDDAPPGLLDGVDREIARRIAMRPWVNPADEWHDVDLPFVCEHNGKIAMCIPQVDGRDAITGHRYRYGPPAQQYGYRLRRWLHYQFASPPCEPYSVATARREEPF